MTTLDPRGLEEAAEEVWRTVPGLNIRTAEKAATAAITAYLAVTQPIVETVEELEELPVGTVVRDKYGDVCQKRPGWWIRYAPGLIPAADMASALPARVIWRPHESA